MLHNTSDLNSLDTITLDIKYPHNNYISNLPYVELPT